MNFEQFTWLLVGLCAVGAAVATVWNRYLDQKLLERGICPRCGVDGGVDARDAVSSLPLQLPYGHETFKRVAIRSVPL